MFANAFRLHPSDQPPGGGRPVRDPRSRDGVSEGEDLAYKVELWGADGAAVEQVLAVTSSPSIGYAAFYAATREFPEAVITLRHRNSVMSKWGGKPN